MSNTDYKGEPIDASWQTAPWNRDGETIEASDDDAHEGNMTTEIWPSHVGDRREFTEKQQAIIEAAAKNKWDNPTELYKNTDLDDICSKAYVYKTLRGNWPSCIQTSSQSDADERSKNTVTKTAEKVKNVRKRALSGESASKISKDYNASEWTIRDWIRGEYGSDISSPPPLEYDKDENQYVPKNGNIEKIECVKDETSAEDSNSKTVPNDDSTSTREPTDTSIDKRKALGVVAVAYVIYRLIRRLL